MIFGGLIGAVVSVQFAWAAECGPCQAKFAELKKQDELLKRDTELLGKNREYLTLVKPSELSKFLKVKSNVMVILTRIDQTKTKIASLESAIQTDNCEKCK